MERIEATEPNRSEDQLRAEVERLRGELAARQAQHETQIVEMRHRAFNHLQIIVSLIRLRMRRTQSEETRRQLSALESYIVALSLLQRHLDTEGADTDFATYLQEQVGLWQPLLTERRIEIRLAVESLTVPAEKAVALALIVNELVTNAYKHAFPDGRSGTVSIALQEREPPWIEVTVQDDGIGMRDEPRRVSIGQTLIKILAAQIGAQVSHGPAGGGTAVRLRFAVERG
ncbi:MAG: sensor histidine kinase [Dongiaceae bacterium]